MTRGEGLRLELRSSNLSSPRRDNTMPGSYFSNQACLILAQLAIALNRSSGWGKMASSRIG